MSKIKLQLKTQLDENISIHKNIIKMSEDISAIILNIKKNKKRW